MYTYIYIYIYIYKANTQRRTLVLRRRSCLAGSDEGHSSRASRSNDCFPNQASHPERSLLFRNVQRFRGGLVFQAHRLLYHSVESNQKEEEEVLFFFFFFFVVTLKRKI